MHTARRATGGHFRSPAHLPPCRTHTETTYMRHLALLFIPHVSPLPSFPAPAHQARRPVEEQQHEAVLGAHGAGATHPASPDSNKQLSAQDADPSPAYPTQPRRAPMSHTTLSSATLSLRVRTWHSDSPLLGSATGAHDDMSSETPYHHHHHHLRETRAGSGPA